MVIVYFYLFLAIITEVVATLLLKASNGWENWWYGLGAMLLYVISGVILALVLKSMSVGLAYAIWSGVGIALVCVASVLLWSQKLDFYAVSGIALIIVGTILIPFKSSSSIQ